MVCKKINNKNKQTGVVLFVGLLLLTVLSMLAVSSMQTASLQELMAGNSKDQTVAFEAAEAALIQGEALLDSGSVFLADFDTQGADGLYEELYDEVWMDIPVWTDSNSAKVTGFGQNGHVAEEPRFVIQHVATVVPDSESLNLDNTYNTNTESRSELFKITARGVGSSKNTQVFLESVYGASM